jgi:hypothetical protein
MNSLVLLLVTTTVSAEPSLAWKETPHSLALLRGEQVVWQLNYKPEEGKPYFHPVTVAGSESLSDLRPADHRWHRAIWFSWKTINGVLYWEEDPQTGKSPGETEVVEVKATAREGHSARVELALSYHPPGQPAVLTERRVLEVTAPAADGSYAIDWQSTFTAGDADVVLDRTPIVGEPQGVAWGGYAGLSLRLVPALRQWQFTDSGGVAKERWKQARWIAFAGPLPSGQSATIAVLDHPQNLRHPTPWYLILEMPYFSPAVLYLSPYTLPAKQRFTLRYRILLQAGVAERDAVENQWKEFAQPKSE